MIGNACGACGRSLAGLLDRFVDALTGPRRRVSMIRTLVAYTAIWTLYGVIAKSTQDIHFDMGEAVVWSRESSWGTPKHPPLSGWIAAVWFAVFPRQDWAYYLLGMTLASVALWVAWRVFRTWLSTEKAAVGLAMLTLVPFFNFHALKFNANSVLIPLWSLVTWTFLRAFQTLSPRWAIAAGASAAAAMLGKYWSALLLLSIGIAALAHPRRSLFFRSWSPWLIVGAGAVVLAPHVVWLADHDFVPLQYAMQTHRAGLLKVFGAGLGYITGALAYVAAPILIALAIVRFRPAVLRDVIAPRDDDRRMIAAIFALPIVLPLVAALLTDSEVFSIWSLAGTTLLPVVLLSSPLVEVSRNDTRRILAVALAMPLLALAASPLVALRIQDYGPPNNAAYYKLLAREMDRVWHETSTTLPLRIVGGSNELINGSSFYLTDPSATFDVLQPTMTPWVDRKRMAREGVVWVCRSDDQACNEAVTSQVNGLAASGRVEVELAPRAFGRVGERRRFTIVATPPA